MLVAVLAAALSLAAVGARAQTLTEVALDLPGVQNGAVAWGDYDQDGDLDLALSGVARVGSWMSEGSDGVTCIYRNDDEVPKEIQGHQGLSHRCSQQRSRLGRFRQ